MTNTIGMPPLKDAVTDLGLPGAVYNYPDRFRWPVSALARQARQENPEILNGEVLTFSVYGRTLEVSATEAHWL